MYKIDNMSAERKTGERMPNSAKKIDESVAKMLRLGRKLELLFTGLFIVLASFSAIAIGVIALAICKGKLFDSSNTVSVLVPLMYMLICCGATWTLRRISRDMARGDSPFTVAHARRIAAIGWTLVAVSLVELVASPGFISITLGPIFLVNSPSAMFDELALPVDVGAILGAVCCFSLATIWRYGSLLQDQTEDLV